MISEFDFENRYIKGKENRVEDSLSRWIQVNHLTTMSSYGTNLQDRISWAGQQEVKYMDIVHKLQQSSGIGIGDGIGTCICTSDGTGTCSGIGTSTGDGTSTDTSTCTGIGDGTGRSSGIGAGAQYVDYCQMDWLGLQIGYMCQKIVSSRR